ncbi:MAG: COX15/CtaA family protein [Planctomycetota bacterium]|jgi:cytochrome c oxidase assembly protein subunit 15|nr:COX15/CtaA family protein [Planctomycetota bacterium]
METRYNRWLHGFAVFTAFVTLVLLVAGGLVTTTDAGDAVPDWWFIPISLAFRDRIFPPMIAGIKIEQGHRLVATLVGMLTLVLAGWLWRTDLRNWLKKLGLFALIAVVIQGILGGMRVRLIQDQSLPGFFAIVHACLAQSFFCVVVAISFFTSKWWGKVEHRLPFNSLLPTVSVTVIGAVFFQLILGAVMRHTGTGLMLHIGFACVVAGLVFTNFGLALRHKDIAGIFRPALIQLFLLLLQIGLGIGTFLILRTGFHRSINAANLHLAVIVGHVAVGALLLAASLVFALEVDAHREKNHGAIAAA